MFKRVIVKISGEALADKNTNTYSNELVFKIIKQISDAINNGTQVSLVVGGGNYWRGRSSNVEMDRTVADQIGMLATVMNALYLSDSFRQKGISAEVFTPIKIGNMTQEFRKKEVINLMSNKGVAIFAAGLGHPFFSTDTITALRAAELDCDCVLYAKNIDGIYNADPAIDKTATKFKNLTYRDIIEKNLQAIDVTAMQISEQNDIDSLVFSLNEENSIINACKNDNSIYEIATKVTSK